MGATRATVDRPAETLVADRVGEIAASPSYASRYGQESA
jgi:hypothetical protein